MASLYMMPIAKSFSSLSDLNETNANEKEDDGELLLLLLK